MIYLSMWTIESGKGVYKVRDVVVPENYDKNDVFYLYTMISPLEWEKLILGKNFKKYIPINTLSTVTDSNCCLMITNHLLYQLSYKGIMLW